eukprot:7421095-Lingulodinium_polyedra.AAC.1
MPCGIGDSLAPRRRSSLQPLAVAVAANGPRRPFCGLLSAGPDDFSWGHVDSCKRIPCRAQPLQPGLL